MATRTLDIPLFVGGSTTLAGPAVDVGDTITITVTCAASAGGTDAAGSNAVGCSVLADVTLDTAETNGVTNFSGSTYSFTYTHTDDETSVFFRDVSGSINASITAPVVDNSQSFATTADSETSCDVSLSSNGSGGTLEYNKSTSTTVPTSGWQASNTVTGLTRGTAYYLWARQGVGYEDRTDTALTPPYLDPDNTITITPSSQSLGATDTSFDITISDIDANLGMYYQVRDSSGTIHENGTPAAGQTSFTLTVTDTPNANPETYDVFSKRLTTSGGGDTYADSGNTFQVAPSGGVTDTAPVISSISQSAGSNANLKDLTVNLSTPGSGGTALEYASSTSNSIPSSGWQSSATFADRTVGTTYYFWASRNKNTSLYSSPVAYTPNNAEYGVIIRNASNQTIVDSRSDKQSTAIKTGSVVIPATTSTVVSGKTYKTITTLNAALYGAPNTTAGTEWTANANGTFTSGTVAEIVTVTGITGMTTTNSDEIDVITQTPGLVGVSILYALRRATNSFEVYQVTVTNYTLNYIAVRY